MEKLQFFLHEIFRRFHKSFNQKQEAQKFLNQIKESKRYFDHIFVIIQEDLRKAAWGPPANLKNVLTKVSMVIQIFYFNIRSILMVFERYVCSRSFAGPKLLCTSNPYHLFFWRVYCIRAPIVRTIPGQLSILICEQAPIGRLIKTPGYRGQNPPYLRSNYINFPKITYKLF